MSSVADAYFERLYAECDDPWSFRERWYERRKRALTLAALPRERYRSIFEPGCANGELSVLLARRCKHLLCCDTSSAAVDLAKRRLSSEAHASVRQSRLPQDWPEGQFDLIVFSELGYYLDRADMLAVIERARASLTPEGSLLACHWRPAIEGCPLIGDDVHALLDQHLGMPRVLRHEEPDLLLDLWSRDPMTVAQREGLRGESV
ncbi:class I SAM-dependent methyltransferase [Pseudomonas sp. RIT-PI-AD]|uniref:class I SAM-dependent methyltransferase n=1 Tax=Pseudomonas sp. RIT-PI-AD TaxID=3035294 RepID=UPI0021D8E027|nr:class I SAM-dependent methyltransferase [Pseudomonas sp. RIT-PI-AD]